MSQNDQSPLIFPKWLDKLRPLAALALGGLPLYVLALLYYGGSPQNLNVGYQPEQPVEYSHALHVGELGIDCRYCHNTVEISAKASIPPTQTCMNCHTNIHPQSEKLEVVRSSYETGLSIPWVRVHDLADYAFFNHSAHVRRGVGCVECHGRVDKMEVVYQTEPLSMGWCLDCHRNPEGRLRDPSRVTDMTWEPKEGEGAAVMQALNLHPNEDCSTCHR